MTSNGCRELLELIEDRHGKQSTVITSQLPVDTWYDYLNDPTLADAILDCIVHNAYTLTLRGESRRKLNSPLTSTDTIS